MAAKKATKKRATRRKSRPVRVLTAEDILGAKDCEPIPVKCLEWGGLVYVKPMNGDDRDEYDQDVLRVATEAKARGEDANLRGIRACVLAASLCDKNGKRLFTMDQVSALGKKNGAVLDRLFDVSKGLNRPTQEHVDAEAGN